MTSTPLAEDTFMMASCLSYKVLEAYKGNRPDTEHVRRLAYDLYEGDKQGKDLWEIINKHINV